MNLVFKKIYFCLFILVQVFLYVYFNLISFGVLSGDEYLTKYITIIVCLFASIVVFVWQILDKSGSGNKQIDVLIPLAMVFTLLADTFLLLLNTNYLAGITAFIIVQIIYFSRNYLLSKKNFFFSLILRLMVWISICIVISNHLDEIFLFSTFYFVNIFVNMIESFIFKNGRQGLLFAIGLLLFVCCDICVGLYNVSGIFEVSGVFKEVIEKGMWIFYLPSQVLIVLSSFTFLKTDKEKQPITIV